MRKFSQSLAVLSVITLAALGCQASPAANVRLPAVISDNMVIQHGAAAPIWGWADPGGTVTVKLGGQAKTAVADAKGKWKVALEPLKAGGIHTMTVAGAEALTVRNILAGEVWVCSGQSNMQWALKTVVNAQQEIAAAKYPGIRLFTVARASAVQPQEDCKGKWVECSPATAAGFSAVGYFFGRDVHKARRVPVGLINTSWSGTPSETWTRISALQAVPDAKGLLERWKIGGGSADADKEKKRYEEALAKWKVTAAKAKAAKKKPPRKPRPPVDRIRHHHRPGNLYNGMIAPLIPFAIRGAIWYQGESNASRAYQYRSIFPAMISDWRKAWGQGDFTFLWVQLANFMARKDQPGESGWAELREAQSMALELPNTGQAVIIDTGEARNIHPKNKQDVGKRLALAAKGIAHGEDIVFSGPAYESMAVEGGKVRLKFRHVGGGLIATGGGELKGFAIAGADKKLVWARAKITPSAGSGQAAGDVVVWSEKVARPVAVRYAWADNPECNLYNKEMLPASPFRTDDWPGVTVKNR